jgi:nucleotide-binding universal stress UspA family protein
MAFQNILVSLDESDLGLQVFQAALELAITCQARLHLLSALQPISPVVDVGPEAMMGGMSDLGSYPFFADPRVWESQVESQQAHTQNWMNQYLTQAQQAGIEGDCLSPTGEPGPAVCEAAAQLQVDLIVIGRRGLSGLTEAFMGSVSNYVTHHASCSVLVIQAS